MVYNGKSESKLMIGGYPYFRKPPCEKRRWLRTAWLKLQDFLHPMLSKTQSKLEAMQKSIPGNWELPGKSFQVSWFQTDGGFRSHGAIPPNHPFRTMGFSMKSSILLVYPPFQETADVLLKWGLFRIIFAGKLWKTTEHPALSAAKTVPGVLLEPIWTSV